MNGFSCRKNFYAQSLLCSVLLTAAVFALLPLSVSVSWRAGDAKPELVRVYSRPSAKTSGSERARSAERTGLPSAPKFAAAAPVFSSDVPSPDFASVSDGAPSFGGTGGASLDADFFGFSDGIGASSEIEIFALDALDSIPRRLDSTKVRYPPKMLSRGAEGEVRLNVVVDESGNTQVDSVEYASRPEFVECAVAAASKFRYESPKKNGRAVRAKFILPIPFKILK